MIHVMSEEHRFFAARQAAIRAYLSQLRDKIHWSSTSTTCWAVGALECWRGSQGHGWERGAAQEITLPAPVLLQVLITEQKHLCTDGTSVVAAEAAAKATQQRAAESG